MSMAIRKVSTDTLTASVEPDEFTDAEKAGQYHYKTTLYYL